MDDNQVIVKEHKVLARGRGKGLYDSFNELDTEAAEDVSLSNV
jgi:hypothetical protein